MNEEKPSTPCVNQCRIDGVYGLCVGCGRTKAEIVAWKNMTEAQRRAIMTLLLTRPGFVAFRDATEREPN
jgi:predicted Fe-S protein YdhL (DUF1289 family)